MADEPTIIDEQPDQPRAPGEGVEYVASGALFEALLRALSQNGERGEVVYERLRTRLIAYLRLRLPSEAEELADLTLDRMARRIYGGTAIHNVYSYALGIARLVVLESRARFTRERSSIQDAAHLQQTPLFHGDRDGLDPEAADAALTGCLNQLGPEGSELILEYYVDSGADRIAARQRLAQRLGLSINALRNRALRLRATLERCMREKLPGRDGSRPADTSDKSNGAHS